VGWASRGPRRAGCSGNATGVRGSFSIFASEDAVWLTHAFDDMVSRIDPLTNEVTTTIETGDGPVGVVVADGALWVTNQSALPGRVERYEPAS
jgi:YVTN family beta-propeller protein